MSNFETWWEREGQGFLYALNTTTDDDIKLVAEVAWKNGAYCAEQTEQEPVAWRWKNGNEWLNKYTYLDNGAPDCPELCEPLYTRPVRTKDLTDDEINKAWESIDYFKTYSQIRIDAARAVIAADREKNRG